MEELLKVTGLTSSFVTNRRVTAVDGVNLTVRRGETVGLVGESGCGKSVTSLSILRLLEPPGKIEAGSVLWEGRDLLSLSEKEMRQVRGNEIAMIFQEPMTSLNPVFTIGNQIAEAFRIHSKISRKEAYEKTFELLKTVKIPSPEQRLHDYPHQLSGGMRQRAMIAMALACRPKLLIADEPTTALDVTIQAQILELIKSLQKEMQMAVLLITHDLAVVAELCDYVLVMFDGRIVEEGPVDAIFHNPQTHYTRNLLSFALKGSQETVGFLPSETIGAGNRRSTKKGLLQATNLSKFFPSQGGKIRAVQDITLTIQEEETLGLVGESGCGKSTLGRTLIRLYEPSSGSITFQDSDLTKLPNREMQSKRREMQIILQDSSSALNPRMTIHEILTEPYRIHQTHSKIEISEDISFLLGKVGLSEDALDRYPHEFSGGQKQRICIARALALRPKFIVCDEAVSALDVSIRAQILGLLMILKEEFQLTYLFISHDLAVVESICDRVAVMYLGKIVELCGNEEIFHRPAHPYTKALLAAVPTPDPRQRKRGADKKGPLIYGDVASPLNPPSGCDFHPRCPLATDTCKKKAPELRNMGSQDEPHYVSCHYA
ncbi:MAG: ABC transporter ATP-binding protein [Deltaproteobacteria bacterium]|nr:ABC transporter ATP-binding protein [Deltaproteobacteria bacterium]